MEVVFVGRPGGTQEGPSQSNKARHWAIPRPNDSSGLGNQLKRNNGSLVCLKSGEFRNHPAFCGELDPYLCRVFCLGPEKIHIQNI